MVWGTSLGELETTTRFLERLFVEGPGRTSPTAFRNSVYSAFAGQLSLALGLRGPSETVSAGGATGAMALARGLDIVAQGEAPAALVVTGSELCDLRIRAREARGQHHPLGEGVGAVLLCATEQGVCVEVLPGIAVDEGPVWQCTLACGDEPSPLQAPGGVSADAVVGRFDSVGGLLAAMAIQTGGHVLDQDQGRAWTIHVRR